MPVRFRSSEGLGVTLVKVPQRDQDVVVALARDSSRLLESQCVSCARREEDYRSIVARLKLKLYG